MYYDSKDKEFRKHGGTNMAVLTFKGGIHPHNDGKDLSKATPITDYTPVGEIVIPMAQHIGAPASPLVRRETGCWLTRR